ncbi:hypothetical protein AAC387_Pa05g0457 [Persea americana]
MGTRNHGWFLHVFHRLSITTSTNWPVGHSITVALSTTGHVFTMGSTSHGQLGNPQSDGKLRCFIQDKLAGEFVDEISCGAFHVAALTSRSEDLLLALEGEFGAKPRYHVIFIFKQAYAFIKWVSGADQSLCSGCRQPFGFTRKRHNCYNCGLVHCHACSSKKALRAALAPPPELQKFQAQVKSLGQKYELQDVVTQKSEKKAREAALFAAEESSKYSAAKEIVKSLTGLMNDMAEKLAPEVYDINNLKSVHAQVEALLKNSGNHTSQCSSL